MDQLREPRLHAGALAGGQDHHPDAVTSRAAARTGRLWRIAVLHAPWVCLARLRRPAADVTSALPAGASGFEPEIEDPKSPVLPLHHAPLVARPVNDCTDGRGATSRTRAKQPPHRRVSDSLTLAVQVLAGSFELGQRD